MYKERKIDSSGTMEHLKPPNSITSNVLLSYSCQQRYHASESYCWFSVSALYFMMIRACARCSVLAVAAWHVTSSFVTCSIDVTIVSTFGRRSTYVALSGVVLRQPRKNMKAEAEDCRRSGQSRREERSHL